MWSVNDVATVDLPKFQDQEKIISSALLFVDPPIDQHLI